MAIPTPEPRIARFERMGYGMFIHWGLYAHLGQGEWVQHLRKVPMDEYARIKDTFTAEEFDGRQIAAIAKAAGMQYITLTSRHHDGFSLYDTRGLSDHDAPHSAAGRDLVAELIEGCRAEGISPHFYHTTLDWYQPSFHNDFDAYLDYLHQSIEVLCTSYGAIGGLWFDGNWSKPDADWKEDRLYGIIRQHQPEAMIVNNTGLSALGALGHPEIDSVTFEQGRPAPMSRADKDKYVAAEMCQTMNRHWGIGAEDFNCMSPAEIIGHLCTCRKVGANYLFNVGPTASGRIPDYESAPHCAASASGSPPIQRPSTTPGPPPSRAAARTSRWRLTTASICSSTTCRGAGMSMCHSAGAAPDHGALPTSSERFRRRAGSTTTRCCALRKSRICSASRPRDIRMALTELCASPK